MVDDRTAQLYQKITLISLCANYKGTISCNSLSCISDVQKPLQSQKRIHQRNSNNNNNNNNNNNHNDSIVKTNRKWQQQIKFYVYDLSREKLINFICDAEEKRLLLFNNSSENIYNHGIRNGDILVFLNGKNTISSPLEQIKNDIAILYAHKEKIIVGTCRLPSDKSSPNTIATTVSYLESLKFDEFSNLATNDLGNKLITKTKSSGQLGESRNILSLLNPFTKRRRLLTMNGEQKDDGDSAIVLVQKDLSQNQKAKRNPSPNRDSGFIETDGTNASLLTQHSGSSRLRSKTSLEKSDSRDELFESLPPSLKNGILNSNNHTGDLLTATTPDTITVMPEISGLKYSDLLSEKYRKSRRELLTTSMTDACNIYTYRSNPVRHHDEAIILRGREIAYEAANASSQILYDNKSITNEIEHKYRFPIVQSYTKDQIRELYGELDEKTRLLKRNHFTKQYQQPPIDAWDEKLLLPFANLDTYCVKRTDFIPKGNWDIDLPWEQTLPNGESKIIKGKFECPLPKLRLDTDNSKNHDFLTTGLSNLRPDTLQSFSSSDKQVLNRNNINISSPYDELSLKPIIEEDLNTNSPVHSVKGNFQTSPGSPLYDNRCMNVFNPNPITFSGTPTGEQKSFVQSIQDNNKAATTEMNSSEQTDEIHDKPQKPKKPTSIDLSPTSSEQDFISKSNLTTPGSCGMYLEPYMRRLYNIDDHWHHSKLTINSTDFEYPEVRGTNQTPTNGSARLPSTEFDVSSYGSITPTNGKKTPTTTQTEFHSILDLETTSSNGEMSYHTAGSNDSRKQLVRKDNDVRIQKENEHLHSTTSFTNDPSDNTSKQFKFDVYESFTSPDDSYYDALASPIMIEIDSISPMTNNLSSLIHQINEINRSEHVNTQNIYDIVKSILEKSDSEPSEPKELVSISNNEQYTTATTPTEKDSLCTQSQTDNLYKIILEIDDLVILPPTRPPPDGSERKSPDKYSSPESEDEIIEWKQQDTPSVNNLATIIQSIRHSTKTDNIQNLKKIVGQALSYDHQSDTVFDSTDIASPIEELTTPDVFESKPSGCMDGLLFVYDDLVTPTEEIADIVPSIYEKDTNVETQNLTAIVSSVTALTQRPPTSSGINDLLLVYDDDDISPAEEKQLIDFPLDSNNVNNLVKTVELIFKHSIQNDAVESDHDQYKDFMEIVDQVPHTNLLNIVNEIIKHHKTTSSLIRKTTWTKSSSLTDAQQPQHVVEQESIVENLKSIINEHNIAQEQSSLQDKQIPVSHLSQIVGDTFLISSKYSYPKVFGIIKDNNDIQQSQEQSQETSSTSSLNNNREYSENIQPSVLTINITQKPLTQRLIDENIPEELYEEYGYRRITRDPETNSVVEKLEECMRRYKNTINDYQTASESVDSQLNDISERLKSELYDSKHEFDETLPFDRVSSSIYSDSEMRDTSGRSSAEMQAPPSRPTSSSHETLDSPIQIRITDMQNMPQMHTFSTTFDTVSNIEQVPVHRNYISSYPPLSQTNERKEYYTTDNSLVPKMGQLSDAAVGYISAMQPRQVIITRSVKNLGGGNRNVPSKMSVLQFLISSAVPLRGGLSSMSMHDGDRLGLIPFTSQRVKEKHLDNIRNKKGIGMQRIREIILHEKKEVNDTLKKMDDDIRTDVANLVSKIANEATQKQLLLAEKTVLEQELKALDTAHKSDVDQLRSKVDSAPFFESELSQAMREIQKQFESGDQLGLRHFAEEAEKIINRGRSLLDSLNLRLMKSRGNEQILFNNYNSKMSHYDEMSSASYSSYKSQIAPRSTNVQRRAAGPGGIMTRMYQSYSSSGGFGGGSIGAGMGGLASIAGLGNFAGIPLRPNRGTSALVAVNETREREKRELCQLNDKFAQYVEKVRFLEAQNRKLQLELEALQNKSGQGSSKIKEMYEVEMSEAKKLIDDTTRDRAAAEVKAREAEKEAGRYRKRYEEILNSREADRGAIDRLQQTIAENEAQINLFRRRLGDLEDEARRYKAETQRLTSEIARLQNEIQNETFVKSSLDTEKMALEDELAMLKQM
ncbi:unnamed protein product, partial [Didymodactylos carnosus]